VSEAVPTQWPFPPKAAVTNGALTPFARSGAVAARTRSGGRRFARPERPLALGSREKWAGVHSTADPSRPRSTASDLFRVNAVNTLFPSVSEAVPTQWPFPPKAADRSERSFPAERSEAAIHER
jgi:hypothetical protein